MMHLQFISTPAMMITGLALYGLFGAGSQTFNPLLDDTRILYAMLIIGGGAEIWRLSVFLPLAGRQAAITRGENPERPSKIAP